MVLYGGNSTIDSVDLIASICIRANILEQVQGSVGGLRNVVVM